ncbi:MAG: metallophosphoesterase [Verrucomicrobia bacterium]|nr:metallophosphoesterase [Verrucomicrobiota bacterium]
MKIIVLGDLHLISPSDKDHAGRQRRKHFAEAWRSFDAVVAAVVREAPDLVISVGDLVDYYSRENRDFAIEQMNRLQTAWMVTPGNHDFAQNYAKDDPEEAKSSIDAIRCDWAKAGVRMDNRSIEADGARVLLVDSHNSGVAENTDEWIRKEVEGSARNILITHVPLSTPEMRAHILEIEPERNLLKYVQSKAPDLFHSAVAGRVTTVISGHLHFSATLSVDGTQMYVLPLSIQAFGKSYRDQGRISIIDTAAHPIQVQHLQLRSF